MDEYETYVSLITSPPGDAIFQCSLPQSSCVYMIV